LTALGRPASPVELEQAQSFLLVQATELGVSDTELGSNVELWRDLCHVVFNLKEFIYIN
jgi:hypothetical protein